MKILLFLGLLGALVFHINGANILGLFAISSQSHSNAIQPLLVGLSKKQHNVTSVSSFRLGEKLDNYVEIYIPPFDFWFEVKKELGVQQMLQAAEISPSKMKKALRSAGVTLVNYFLSQPKLKELLHSAKTFPYDAIIVDLFYTEALLMIGQVYGKPIIAVSSSNFEEYMTNLVDYSVPSACLPIDFQNNEENPSFFNRILIMFECMQRRSERKDDLDAQERVAKLYFEKINSGSIGSLQDHISILLVNNYSPLLKPRPVLSNIIPVGGLHIKPTQNIQWNIKRFLDDARVGAIYFSLGITLKCSDLSKEKLDLLVAVFGKQKQRIVWHCDLEKIENLPKNVLLQNIVYSSDVLAHPHIRLFMTSGGLLSLQEAIYRNVPILGIPIFYDQHQSMKTIEYLRIGLKLDFSNLTERSLSWALQTLTTDLTFLSNIREVSLKFRDRPLGAIPMSIFWIEHVLKYTNVSDLKTMGIHLPWHQQHLVDVLVLLLLSVTVVLILGAALFKISILIYKKQEQSKLLVKLK